MQEILAAEPDTEIVMIDASIVSVHQHDVGAKGLQFQAIGIKRGLTSRIHVAVDALGNRLQFEVTAGSIHDCVTGYEVLQSLGVEGKNVLAISWL